MKVILRADVDGLGSAVTSSTWPTGTAATS